MSDIVENCDNSDFGIGSEDLAKLELDDGTNVLNTENSEINDQSVSEVEVPVVTDVEEQHQIIVEEEPVAEEPVAEEPVAEEPVAEEPVVEEPVAEEPVAEEPVASEEPVAEEPVASEEPVEEEPLVDEPVVEEPVASEEPVVEEPVESNVLDEIVPSFQETQNITISVEEPVVEVVEEPVVEVVEEPVAEVVEEPVAEVVEEPVAEVVEEPVVEVVEEPVVTIEPEPTPSQVIPKIVFIVPYRNRESQLEAFKSHMAYILQDYPKEDYVIHYIHQKDERIFNRGAMKNIGFLVVKNKYPNDYKNITLVFNDVDTMPVEKNLFHYDTIQGVVKHFFGFTYTLGGIVSIKAGDFERVNGFPNFWAWGYEDNLIQRRIEKIGITIDRSIFYKMYDKNIIQRNEELTREINQSEYERYLRNTNEGIYSIQNLDYTIDNGTGFVDVKWFTTEYNPNVNQYKLFDLREGSKPYDTKFGLMYNNRRIRGGRMRMGI
jgi:hypothetical protein